METELIEIASWQTLTTRPQDFGVDFEKLGVMVAADCPKAFFELAQQCCSLIPDQRLLACLLACLFACSLACVRACLLACVLACVLAFPP
jgi:hypothetical protein